MSILLCPLNAAKLCISPRWKDPQPPSIRLWLHRVDELNQMEDLVFSAQAKASCTPKLGFFVICLSILRRVSLFSMLLPVDSESWHQPLPIPTSVITFLHPPFFFHFPNICLPYLISLFALSFLLFFSFFIISKMQSPVLFRPCLCPGNLNPFRLLANGNKGQSATLFSTVQL